MRELMIGRMKVWTGLFFRGEEGTHSLTHMTTCMHAIPTKKKKQEGFNHNSKESASTKSKHHILEGL